VNTTASSSVADRVLKLEVEPMVEGTTPSEYDC
jgi:hypothetical protein